MDIIQIFAEYVHKEPFGRAPQSSQKLDFTGKIAGSEAAR